MLQPTPTAPKNRCSAAQNRGSEAAALLITALKRLEWLGFSRPWTRGGGRKPMDPHLGKPLERLSDHLRLPGPTLEKYMMDLFPFLCVFTCVPVVPFQASFLTWLSI